MSLAGFDCSSSHGGAADGAFDTAAAWASITTAEHHSCAVTTDGRLFCWGYNRAGQLGDGTMTSSSTPVQVGAETDWIEVSAGASHTCGRRSDRTLWCWGSNIQSQLGTGESSLSPMQVGSSADWAQIAAGSVHTCAIRDDGTLWCWGSNLSDQLGVVTESSEQPAPVQVGSDTDWARITAGGHSCGLREDGSLWCRGANGAGQLGIRSRTAHHEPVQVGSASDWVAVATAVMDYAMDAPDNAHTCGLRSDGTIWCWGYNHQGQLGDGTNDTREAPVQVVLPE